MHIYGIHLLNPYKTVVSHLKKKVTAEFAFTANKRKFNKMDKGGFHGFFFTHLMSAVLPLKESRKLNLIIVNTVKPRLSGLVETTRNSPDTRGSG